MSLPMMNLSTMRPSAIRSAMGFAPAGNLNSGVPGATLAAGAYRFQTKIRVVGYRPTPNLAGFASALEFALTTAAPYVRVASSNVISMSDAAVTLASASGRPSITLDSWWVTIVGTFGATSATTLENLNKGIAAAFVRSTAFAAQATHNGQPVATQAALTGAMARPTSNSDSYLQAVLRNPRACAGHVEEGSVFRQACTRWEPLTASEAQAILTRMGTGAANAAANQAAQGVCTIRSLEAFFLRPTATYATTGQRFPVGTTVTITGPQALAPQGAYTLFPVRVGTQTGFAAFNAAEIAACRAASPGVTIGAPGGPTVTLPGPANIPGVTTPAPGLPSIPGITSRPALCTVTSLERFWLRPTRTFAQTGPQFPVGTSVAVLDGPFERQGNFALFAVRVGTQEGFAALNPQEVASCPQAQRFTGQSAPSTPSAPAPAPTATPAPNVVRASPLANVGATGMSTGTKTAIAVVGTAAVLAAVGGAVYYGTKDLG